MLLLHERIAAQGPVTFAEFMETALYHPQHGFYEQAAVGEEAHFVTSPHVSPLFAELLAGQLEECWKLLGGPDPFDVVEAGAGHGTLALQLLDCLSGRISAAIRYTAVERSAAGRTAMAAAGLRVASGIGELEPGLVGCVVANELLDNLPFHRLRGTDHGPVELLVGVRDGRLELIEGPVSSDGLLAFAHALAPGREAVASPAAKAFVAETAAILRPGYMWLIDYGSDDRSIEPSVHGYRRHRLEEDVLAEPGASDIKARRGSGADLLRTDPGSPPHR